MTITAASAVIGTWWRLPAINLGLQGLAQVVPARVATTLETSASMQSD
jgi:hypothetical protein